MFTYNIVIHKKFMNFILIYFCFYSNIKVNFNFNFNFKIYLLFYFNSNERYLIILE